MAHDDLNRMHKQSYVFGKDTVAISCVNRADGRASVIFSTNVADQGVFPEHSAFGVEMIFDTMDQAKAVGQAMAGDGNRPWDNATKQRL